MDHQISKLDGHANGGTLPTSLTKQTYKIWVSKDVEEDEEILKIIEQEKQAEKNMGFLRLTAIISAKRRELHLVTKRTKDVIKEFQERVKKITDFETSTLSNLGIACNTNTDEVINNLRSILDKFIISVVSHLKDKETSRKLLQNKKQSMEEARQSALSNLEDTTTIQELVRKEVNKLKFQKNLPGRLTKSPKSTTPTTIQGTNMQKNRKKYQRQTKH